MSLGILNLSSDVLMAKVNVLRVANQLLAPTLTEQGTLLHAYICRHAVIVSADDSIMIMDCESVNGTFVPHAQFGVAQGPNTVWGFPYQPHHSCSILYTTNPILTIKALTRIIPALKRNPVPIVKALLRPPNDRSLGCLEPFRTICNRTTLSALNLL